MGLPDSANSDRLSQAQEILAPFSGLHSPPLLEVAEADQVRAALLQLAEGTDYQMFGILADHYDQGVTALHAYCQAFGYDRPDPGARITGPIYLKFNANRQSCYIDSYTEEHRGVLIAYQSLEDEQLNQTYGHFPLNLFDQPCP
ncbi:MAG: DUF1824 family protein [Acaryochloridaceae cyanobacterium SU_2_1]|nr:DUF1824 family protein [Acaryochloridaceae cyanobacterium SU_2_1]